MTAMELAMNIVGLQISNCKCSKEKKTDRVHELMDDSIWFYKKSQ